MIAIIDYGMGNLRSVQKAIEASGGKTMVITSGRALSGAAKIVFPGVGAFGDAMRELKKRKFIAPIKKAIRAGKPFLGLCLGLQLLFEESEEGGRVKGLGILKGKVRRFKFAPYAARRTQHALKIPHMGWNTITRRTPYAVRSTDILHDIPDSSFMYFVHSYYVAPEDRSVILTTTDYGVRFVSGVCKANVYGLQFHPEKSQGVGLKILRNFVRL